MKYAQNKNRNYKRINDKILNAYYEFLMKNGNVDTNITELCKLAKINRTTFYKHYKDLSQISSELESEFIYNAFSTTEDASIVEFVKNPCPSFRKLNKNVLANKTFYKIILRPDRLSIFIEKIAKYLIDDVLKYRPEFVKLFKNPEECKLSIYNTVNTIASAYSMWLRDNFKISIEELSNKICENLVAIYKHADRYKCCK